MNRVDIISSILVQNKLFQTMDEAQREVIETFYLEFSDMNYEEWNKQLPGGLATRIIFRFADRRNLSLRYLIQDIEVVIAQELERVE